jgi:hypothetical protein
VQLAARRLDAEPVGPASVDFLDGYRFKRDALGLVINQGAVNPLGLPRELEVLRRVRLRIQ